MLSKINAVAFLTAVSLFLLRVKADPDEYKNPDGKTIWDEAPKFKDDSIQPYPDLKGPNGKELTIKELRGVHLFGFKGCTEGKGKAIKESYDDFYELANQPELYDQINWSDKVIEEYFGPNTDNLKIPDDTRGEIKQIFEAARKVRNHPWTWQPPWKGWEKLWIEVRCSDAKSIGDAEDACNNPKKCGLQAFSTVDSDIPYSRITFCDAFFALPSLTKAMESGKEGSRQEQDDMENWNNRARVFFHEMTHLDSFMNADDKDDNSLSPEVFDVEFNYKRPGQLKETAQAYGPYYAKMLRNFIPKDAKLIGYYTQRNADNYAWAALTKYVQKAIGRYPPDPSPGPLKPLGKPKRTDGKSLSKESIHHIAACDVPEDALVGGEEKIGRSRDFKIPECGDKFEGNDIKDKPKDKPKDNDKDKDESKDKSDEDPERWKYKHGEASKGQWAAEVKPGRWKDFEKTKRSDAKAKRFLPTLPKSALDDAELTTWIQDGKSSKRFGPLKVDCNKSRSKWQHFYPKSTGLKHRLSVKSGNACQPDLTNWNMDWTALKYRNIKDLAVSSDKRCFDVKGGGVSCVIDLNP